MPRNVIDGVASDCVVTSRLTTHDVLSDAVVTLSFLHVTSSTHFICNCIFNFAINLLTKLQAPVFRQKMPNIELSIT
jgi:hypothetical protein